MSDEMRLNYASYRLRSLIFLVATLSPMIDLSADPPEAPIATASDIDFSVEYSTNKLMLGDILYAKITIRNKTDHTVQITKYDGLIIEAKSSMASQTVCSYQGFGSGLPLLRLPSGKEIVYSRMLSMFGNHDYRDSAFNPFDSTLESQAVLMRARRATLAPLQMENMSQSDYVMRHEKEIQFGPPLIGKAAFADALAIELTREGLEPMKCYFHNIHSSYLITHAMRSRYWYNHPDLFAATLSVMSKALPVDSSLGRAAVINLKFNEFIDTNGDVENQAIFSIFSLVSEMLPMEQQIWRSFFLQHLYSVTTDSAQMLVSEQKRYRFEERMLQAGIYHAPPLWAGKMEDRDDGANLTDPFLQKRNQSELP